MPRKGKQKQGQVTLHNVGAYPLLKKPAEAIGTSAIWKRYFEKFNENPANPLLHHHRPWLPPLAAPAPAMPLPRQLNSRIHLSLRAEWSTGAHAGPTRDPPRERATPL